eukprot:NODE_417_length_1687_cov_304.648352_g327_i0.p1 GENE.NODE_417_length_1687_cov_304.648352_g327_i0~~NODE_417_length_1687_cov_304.648352_g327_i0.p1  ORF type:complete len:457 (+),score=125.79 NODE_417_length_1687_cov_304.648352_g327_i0:190-1560(+)
MACRRAHITVRMVTGDNMHTAIAIAQKCKLITEADGDPSKMAMEGKDFRALAARDPERLLKIIPNLRVLARSSPTDKLVLVSCLMDEGDIVAVTGDGTNDAPALKLADVGFSMKTGTEVACGASDMVLMDDNFASVVKACVWGRTVNDNIRKFLQFQLTVNVAGVLLTLIGAVLSDQSEEPLKPVQMLWLNLIMDTLAALALATEKPSAECLDRLPFYRAAPLLSKRMIAFILGHGFFQLTVQLLLLAYGHIWAEVGSCLPEDEGIGHMDGGHCRGGIIHSTIVFNTFIWMQLINEFNSRNLYGQLNPFARLGNAKLFLVILCMCVVFQVVAVEFLGSFMHTHSLNSDQWGRCIALALLELPVGFIINLLPVKNWTPGPNTDNKAGLDAKKREVIAAAKMSAGMVPMEGSPRTVNAFARNRWKKATIAVRTVKRVEKTTASILRRDRSLRGWAGVE